MQSRKFGSTGRMVPVVGQGTWNMEADDRAAALAALNRGIDLGMTHIDPPSSTVRAKSKSIIAPVVAAHRDRLFLVSKVMPSNASRAGTVSACERSLKRLGTDRLDCYLCTGREAIRWPTPSPPSSGLSPTERSCPGAQPPRSEIVVTRADSPLAWFARGKNA